MSVCVICKKRQAKRSCPALNAKICPICCATDRMMELACPESCVHLETGRQNAAQREGHFMAQARAAAGLGRPHLHPGHLHIIGTIHKAIAEVRRSRFRDLRDSDILAALVNAHKNLETADSGLIYEHPVTSPPVRAVSEHIREELETLSKTDSLEGRLTRSKMMGAMSFEIETLELRLREQGDGQHYLQFFSLFVPWETKEGSLARPEPLIVL